MLKTALVPNDTFVCTVAVVSSVVVMSSHVITNSMRFYFFQSKCVVIVSSACHFPTRGGMQCKSVKRSLRFVRSKFENFMGYPWCFLGRFGLVKEKDSGSIFKCEVLGKFSSMRWKA